MTIGFIGCGNMAKAMIGGIIANGYVGASDICVSAKTQTTLENAAKTYGVKTFTENKDVAEAADILILAVKPAYMQEVIEDIKESTKEHEIIVTLAPGKTLAWVKEQFGKEIKLVRTMPNTPAMVCEGMTGLCPNENVTDEEITLVKAIFDCFGKSEVVSEKLMDVVVGVSGSSPAYVYMFIEAMADAAVADGMPRAQAYRFAAQAVLGSAKMVLETGLHPGVLKDQVCSPAGTTIEAVAVLEAEGFRGTVIDACRACVEKAKGC